MFIPKQMRRLLLISFSEVNAGNASENLLNEILQIIYFLHQAKGVTRN